MSMKKQMTIGVCLACMLAGWVRPAAGQMIYREYYLDIAGSAVADLTAAPDFPDNPSGHSWETLFEAPTDFGDAYGTRMRGYVVPPADGPYTFWISSDDQSELYLSTDDAPANKVQIARVQDWTNFREWDNDPAQQSPPINLQAGHRYYIEALHKENAASDHVSVGWQLPDSTLERPIPGNRLIPFLNAPTLLIASGTPWKYLDDGSDQVAAWKNSGFNDSAWSSGPSPLGFGQAGLTTTVGGPGVAITYYFRRGFQVNNAAGFTSLAVRLRRDDGALVYLNGTEIFRSNMPPGPVGYQTVAMSAPDDGAGWHTNGVNPSLLVNGVNIVAVEIHQNALASSDLVFDLELMGNPDGSASENQPPTISDVADQTINANTSSGPLAFQVQDVDNPPATLILMGASDNTVLLPDANIVFGGAGSNRTVTVTPASNQAGSALVTLTVSDGELSAMDTFLLTVSDVPVPPSILVQPMSQSVAVGATVTFTVEATGSMPLSYQWRKDGIDLVGSNEPTLTLNNVSAADAGGYDVQVANALGSVTSQTALLTVQEAPVITQQPVSQSVLPGATVVFSVEATGSPPLAYQWLFNGGTISGANETMLTFENVQPQQAGTYQVTVSNQAGTTTSDAAMLEVNGVDFGDAPDDEVAPLYPTLLVNNGARHFINTNLMLGFLIDGETNGQPDDFATGDNLAGVNDEDGIRFLTDPLVPGMTADIEVTATVSPGISARLEGWIDYNLDRTWNNLGVERIFTNQMVLNGVQIFTILVPTGAVAGTSYARFRIHRDGSQNVGPEGAAPLGFGEDGELGEGEVEDYLIEIQKQTGVDLSVSKVGDPNPVLVGDTLTYSLTASNAGPDLAMNVVVTDTLPAEVALVSAEVEGGSCTTLDNVVTCMAGDLAAGDSAVVTIQVIPLEATTLSNCASVMGEGTELNPANNDTCIVTVSEARPQEMIPCDQTNKGTNFWLTFPGNYAPDQTNRPVPRLCIVGMPGVTGNVTIQDGSLFQNFIMPPTMHMVVDLPPEADVGDLNNDTVLKGVHVTADDNVAVFAMNKVTYTSDGYLALPSVVFGTEYVVQAWGNVQSVIPELDGSEFALVACEDNTAVTITPSATTGDLVAGESYTLTLEAGEVYQLRNTNGPPSDITGTIISSTSPVGVFAGHMCANIPNDDVFACDYVVEQLLPVNQGGTEFITVPLYSRVGGDTFRILALEDGTTVTIHGTNVTLDLGQANEVLLSEPTHIAANHKVLVTQFANSSDYDNVALSDPFMTLVPDVTKFYTNHMICVPEEGFVSNYANVIFPKDAVVSLNGLPAVWLGGASDIDASGFSVAQIPLPTGTNILSSTAPFGSIIYGFNPFESYGYPGAMFFGDTEPPTFTCSISEDTVVADETTCLGKVPTYLEIPQNIEDNCSSLSDTRNSQDPPAGTMLGVGVYQVEVHVTDGAGNVGTCILTLSVVDQTPPRIDCPPDMTVTASDSSGAVVTYNVSVSDNCDPSPELVCVPPPGSTFPIGTTNVTCVATDASGNSTMCTFQVTVMEGPGEQGLDFGDAKDPTYPTLLSSDGARHQIVAGWYLGKSIDAETNGFPSADALGDDTHGTTPDDEDGVRFLSTLVSGASAAVEVVSSTNGMLDAWIDFNRDGSWERPEQIFTNKALVTGTNNLSFMVPGGLMSGGQTTARFRLSATGGLGVRGLATEGEVEDYAVELYLNFDDQNATPSGQATVNVISNTLVVANIGSSGEDGVEIPLTDVDNIVWQGSFYPVTLDTPNLLFTVNAYGDVDGASGVFLAGATLANMGAGPFLTADFSGVGGDGSNFVAEIWNTGTMVGEVANPMTRLDILAFGGAGLNRCRVVLDTEPYFAFGFSQMVDVMSDTGPVSGDEIVVKFVAAAPSPMVAGLAESDAAASSSPPNRRLRQVHIRAANIPSLSIRALEASAPSPRIRIHFLPEGGLAISWLQVPIVFRLEGTANLGPAASWQPVIPESNVLLNGRRTLRVAPTDPKRFFRLTNEPP
jgi:uncharacterized repeat protein (TIGR01451 family)